MVEPAFPTIQKSDQFDDETKLEYMSNYFRIRFRVLVVLLISLLFLLLYTGRSSSAVATEVDDIGAEPEVVEDIVNHVVKREITDNTLPHYDNSGDETKIESNLKVRFAKRPRKK